LSHRDNQSLDSVTTNRHILQALPPSWLYHLQVRLIKQGGKSSSSLFIEGLEAASSFMIPQLLPVHWLQPFLMHLSANLKRFSGSPCCCAFSINASFSFTGVSSSATVLLACTTPSKLAPLLHVALGHSFDSSASILNASCLNLYSRTESLFLCNFL